MKLLISILFLLLSFSISAQDLNACADYYQASLVEINDPTVPSLRYISCGPVAVFSVRMVDGEWQTQINGYVLHSGLTTEQEANDLLNEFVESVF